MPSLRLIPINEPPAPQPEARRFALFSLGFRPFYLLAAFASSAAMIAWMGVLEGLGWYGHLPAAAWHQHEMVFGFALAVITGFLLTAGRLWTGRATPEGGALLLIALHWLAARVLLFTGPLPFAMVVDGAYPFVLTAVMGRVIFAAKSHRNYFAVAMLCLLGLANLGFFAEQLGAAPWAEGHSVRAALYLVILLIIVIGGRVVPSFTANALGPSVRIKRGARLDWLAMAATAGTFLADLASAPSPVIATLAALAALSHGARQRGWAPWATLQRPILWILHLSHAWIPAGLLLLCLATLDFLPRSAAMHALGAGAIGGMIIAMITRTALGHTGRALRAGWPEIAAYALVHIAAAARVTAGVIPAYYQELAWLAGHLWALAFLIYFVTYLPRLAFSEGPVRRAA